MILSPISYPGNKAKLLDEIIPNLISSSGSLVDVFAGSGIVGINSHYNNIYCNDVSEHAIELLRYFYETKTSKVISETEKIIKEFNLTYSRIYPKNYYPIYKNEGLSKHNKESYLELRKDYNKEKSPIKLFVLLIYGFNHYIRYNKNNEFNVPVGKGDFSQSIYDKTISFVDYIKTKNINFSTYDFREKKLYKSDDAIFYFDPPYLITQAPYNIDWTEKEEKDLLNILDDLNNENKNFVLSNVFVSNGKSNDLLIEWSKKYNVIKTKRQYRNANYRRKNKTETIEVIIKNF